MNRFTTLCLLGISALVASNRVDAQTFNTSFGGAGYTCVNVSQPSYCNGSNNLRPASVLLGAGDFFSQSIGGSGLASVSTLNLNLKFIDLLNGMSNIQFAVLLNGTVVGSTPVYGANDFNEIVAPFTFNFGAISAATYDVKVRVSAANIPSNGEGFSMYTDNVSTIQLVGATTSVVPEPNTSLLVMAGLAGIAALARRRRARA